MALSPAVSVHSILLGLGDRRLLSIWRCTSTAQVYRCEGYFDTFAVGAAISMRRASLYCPVAVVSPHLILSKQRPERQGLCEPNSQIHRPGCLPGLYSNLIPPHQSINQSSHRDPLKPPIPSSLYPHSSCHRDAASAPRQSGLQKQLLMQRLIEFHHRDRVARHPRMSPWPPSHVVLLRPHHGVPSQCVSQ